MTTQAKLRRLEARITEEQKARFERAARLQGRTLTDFVIGTMEEAAAKVIQQHSVLTLSAQDSLGFAQAILESPAPSSAFLGAVDDYHRHLDER